ncbi:PEP/pyruvate-binding domain-containing protein [Kribbella sp.]|uniref:PEP/pyruvate-binding domain-containing protein n=1 Tax=Kribbella sp. TaxID=1871183 RepID=UPI002D43667C|nr:PEP/pyruvate-binding domain-containing protein [Kribbella sp.]HZX04658.1 PEP/pyruvate-binding domain-containing protein [Kribbella sp.]
MNSEYVVQLNDAAKAALDPSQVGLKVARLAELARQGIRVPAGFAVTAAAYREFVRDARLGPAIAQAIRRFRAGRELAVAAAEIRSAFRDESVPASVADEILAAYDELGGDGTDVAVRCSPVTVADGLQDEVFLHLTTAADVLAACRRCFASLYNPVAVGNREAEGLDQLKAVMPVAVQRMVPADLGGTGTARGESAFVRVRATWGLGDAPTAGADQYSVHPGDRPLIVRHCGNKPAKKVYAYPRGTRTVPTTPQEQAALVLSDNDLQTLARWSVLADKHFRRPTTLDWAKDGRTGELFVVEVRPGPIPTTTIRYRDLSTREIAKEYR